MVHLLLTLQLVVKNAQMSLAKWFFALFPKIKKSAKLASHSGSELLPESSPSTPAAQLEDSAEWVQLRERHAGKTDYWNRRTNSTVWQVPAGVEAVWYGLRDEKGVLYFWHRDTHVSTYDLPPLPPGRGAAPPAQGGFQILGAVPSLLCRDLLHREQWSLVLPSTDHTARVGSDHFGAAHTGFFGVRALPCGLDYDQFPLCLLC